MPKEYIDRAEIVEELRPLKCGNENYDDGIDTAISVCSVYPAADVVEIVRCKDCRHAENDPVGVWCYNMRFYMPEMFYCAKGERRMDDERVH